MAGERDLGALLAGLDPVLHPGELVWCTVPADRVPDGAAAAAFARIVEDEGVTLVVPVEVAEEMGLVHEVPCRRIELRVHSDLAAVGLTSAVAGTLAGHGISANVVAAFHHDHVLVPAADADRALAALRDLVATWAGPDGPDRTSVFDHGAGVSLLLGPSGAAGTDLGVELGVARGAGLSAVVEGWWSVAVTEQLATVLDAMAAGERGDQQVGDDRDVALRLRPREGVDRWEVVILAAGGDSSARVVTTLAPAACAAAADRVRTARARAEGR